MRTKFFLILMISLTSFLSWSQAEPKVTLLTPTKIVGRGTPNAILHVKSSDAASVINNTIPDTGIIDFDLSGLTAGIDAIVWETVGNIDSKKIVVPILTESQALRTLTTAQPGSSALNTYQESQKLMANDLLMRSTIATYQRTILTTNFTLPVARFDVNKPQYDSAGNLISDSKGSISLFSSFGFGIGVCAGRSEITRDSNGVIIDDSFSNTFGVYLGILYQATTGENEKNVFAPTLSLSVLDIQIGIGYDYGKVPASQERTFITVSYGIPLYKLFKTNHRVWLSDPLKTPVSVKRI